MDSSDTPRTAATRGIGFAALLAGAWLSWLGQGAESVPYVLIAGLALLAIYARSAAGGWSAFLGVTIAYTGAWDLAYAPTMPLPFPWRLLVSASVGAAFGLVFLGYRLVAARGNEVAAMFFLPSALVSLDFAMSLFSPGGTGGSFAYSLADRLFVAQLVSATGWLGLTFLISWLAALSAHAWNRRAEPGRVAIAAVAGAGVLGATAAFGAGRLMRSPDVETVPIAAIVAENTYEEDGARRADVMAYLNGEPRAASSVEAARAFVHGRIDRMLALAERELAGGARIALLPEANPVIPEGDLSLVTQRAGALARRYAGYVGVAPYVVAASEGERDENLFILMGPDGDVVWRYQKSRLVPGSDHAVGPGVLPTHDADGARVAGAICFDLDFPRLMGQLSRSSADILLAPSRDWHGIARLHRQMARLRAIEQGVALVRPVEGGITLVTDAFGRGLGERDTRGAGEYALIVDVPASGRPTLYGRVGDAFAIGSLLLCGATLLVSLGRHRRPGRVPPVP
jgi:apolipoprotein N-acyltransferase